MHSRSSSRKAVLTFVMSKRKRKCTEGDVAAEEEAAAEASAEAERREKQKLLAVFTDLTSMSVDGFVGFDGLSFPEAVEVSSAASACMLPRCSPPVWPADGEPWTISPC